MNVKKNVTSCHFNWKVADTHFAQKLCLMCRLKVEINPVQHVVVRWVPTGLCVFWVCVYIGMDTSLLVRIISQSPSSIVEHLFVFSCDSIEDFFYFGSKT